MNKFVIKRTDQGGGYVSRPGSTKSYTNKLELARTWTSKADAEAERCVENEVVLSIDQVIR